ncbi:hypothetical protein L9F63_004582, partial [Diploptera punctata]
DMLGKNGKLVQTIRLIFLYARDLGPSSEIRRRCHSGVKMTHCNHHSKENTAFVEPDEEEEHF